MKITSVELLKIDKPLPYIDGTWHPYCPIIVKVNTDEGIHGLGEVGMAYGVGASAGYGMAKDLAKMIIGRDPMCNEKIWDDMMHKTFWGQGGGTAVFGGMSALDMALWDIKGKALNTPVYQLLGGKCRDDLRTYASQIQLGWSDKARECNGKPEEYAKSAMDAVNDGYDSVKVDLLWWDENGKRYPHMTGKLPYKTLKMVEDRLAAIRDAVGPDIDIMVEGHCYSDVASGIQLGKIYENYNVMFFEEANAPLNPAVSSMLKDKLKVPIASGERIYSRWGYIPFFQSRSLDVLQPDLGTVGGLTEGKKVADMAKVYDMTIQAHVCGSPIATAAALHYEIAIPNFCIHEHHRNALLAGNRVLCKYDYQPVNGRFTVPELPGLGQELTDEAYKLATIEVVK